MSFAHGSKNRIAARRVVRIELDIKELWQDASVTSRPRCFVAQQRLFTCVCVGIVVISIVVLQYKRIMSEKTWLRYKPAAFRHINKERV